MYSWLCIRFNRHMADVHVSTSDVAGESSESTVDIHIKTLDSQLYDFHVDKNMLVSTFKEKIASDVGLPVTLQRLIFRGRVLKDEHRLSEYHVESGHTLHLVARQPSSGSSTGTTSASGGNTGLVISLWHIKSYNVILHNCNEGHTHNVYVVTFIATGQDANAAGLRPRIARVSHSILFGTFGGGSQSLGGARDTSPVMSAVFDSFGARDANVNNQSQPRDPSQPAPQGTQNPLGTGIAIPILAMVPIPNSLRTLSVFMNRMEQALSQNGYQPNQPLNGAEQSPTVELPSSARGVPLPAALAVVMRHAQRLLSGPIIDSLSHTASRLEEEENCTDPTVRAQIQSEAMQSGLAMLHLGSLLLELGRTMMTLRIGRSPAESSVRAGPAVYISSSGPNPIMVQPFPLQTNSLFGGNAIGVSSMDFGPVGMGAVPRNINVHIRSGIGQSGPVNEGQPANGAAMNGTNSQTRVSYFVSTGQPEGAASGVSNPPGIGLADVFRYMLGQLAQNPAMRNIVDQAAQEIDDDQDLENMFAGMGGPGSGGGDGGFDMSSMIQLMMPIFAQAFGGGGGSSSSSDSDSASTPSQPPPSMDREQR
ncbi:ubiquitin-like domain-containing protein CIP73 isoform X3 [Bidens hawaiensis]|uniref:ubiquitin-like domain-containing protein CIP73 isoform X3 n=1 Tax=Bidens hawaiensis TaxID=980011 RepID=UPI004049A770